MLVFKERKKAQSEMNRCQALAHVRSAFILLPPPFIAPLAALLLLQFGPAKAGGGVGMGGSHKCSSAGGKVPNLTVLAFGGKLH